LQRQQALGVDDQAQVHRVRERLQSDQEVVLGLQHSEDFRPGRSMDRLGPRAPAGLVDAVIGLPEADVERRSECCPPEPIAASERLPVGCVPVATVEHDQCLADRRDVTCDGSGLRSREVNRQVRRGVAANTLGLDVGVGK